MGKKILFTLVTVAAVFTIVFLFGEIFLRMFYPQKTWSVLKGLVGEQYVDGGFIPFTLKAGYTARQESQQYRGKYITVKTNSLGLRSSDIRYEKEKGVKRILILGDSYTFGVFVENWETYPAVLERLYKESGKKVEVINAGYADGRDPDQMYAWLNNVGFRFDPDIVVYGFFVGNDIPRSGNIVQGWQNIDQRGLPLKVVNKELFVDKDGLLRSRKDDEQTVGKKMIYRIPVLRESHLCVVLSERIGNLYKTKKQIRRINGGWSADPFPYVLKEKSSNDMMEGEAVFKNLIKGMKSSCDERGIKFVVVMIPVSFQVEPSFLKIVMQSDAFSVKRNYFEEIKPEFQKQGIGYIDLLDKMRGSGKRYFFSSGDVHFSPEGHLFVAKQIERYIDENGLMLE